MLGGVFSHHLFPKSFIREHSYPSFPLFKPIGKVLVPRKVQVFPWLLMLGKFLKGNVIQRCCPKLLLSQSWCDCAGTSLRELG